MKSLDSLGLRNYFNPFIEKMQNFDLVHIQYEHSFFSGNVGIEAAYEVFGDLLSRINIPCLITFHSNPIIFLLRDLLTRRPSRHDIELLKYSRIWMERVAKVINKKKGLALGHVHTQFSLDIFKKSGINDKYMKAVYVGVDEVKPKEEKNELLEKIKEQLGLSGKFVIAMFGFVVPAKGYNVAIDAIRSLGEDYHLFIIGGESPYQPQHYNEIAKYVRNDPLLNKKVTITGYIDKAKADLYLSLSDIAVAPYQDAHQSSTGAAMQCLKSNLALIASDIPLFKDIKKKAGCVETFRKGNSKDLVNKITKLYKDQQYKNNLANKGLLFAKESNWGNYTASISKIYEELLQKAGKDE